MQLINYNQLACGFEVGRKGRMFLEGLNLDRVLLFRLNKYVWRIDFKFARMDGGVVGGP